MLTNITQAQSCEGRVLSLISDAARFALHNRHTIENAPLQAYVSALILSPINSMIRKEFSHEEPTWVKPKPIIESTWSPCTQTLEGHSDSVHSVAFSPNGQQIASGSRDGTIKVWDGESGACSQTLEGRRNYTDDIVAVETSSTSHFRVLANKGWIGIATRQNSSRPYSRYIADRQHTTAAKDDRNNYESAYRYGNGLSTDTRWIFRHEQNILWLPPDYRPSSSAVWCFPSQASTASCGLFKSTVALGCPSGRVIVLGLVDDGSPL